MEQKFFGYVYVHTDKTNGKQYIGQSIQPSKRRWRETAYRSSVIFYNALRARGGFSQFESKIIEYALSQKELDLLEEKYIKEYKTLAPNGYNALSIAVGKVVYTPEVRKKISDSHKEFHAQRKHEIVAINRKHHKFENEVETKHCSRCNRFKTLDNFVKFRRTWDGLFNFCKSCVKKKRKYPKRLSQEQWKESYRTRNEKMTFSVKKAYEDIELRNLISERNRKPLKAINVKTGETLFFKSAMEAKVAGFNNTCISRCIKQNKPYRGFIWSKVS